MDCDWSFASMSNDETENVDEMGGALVGCFVAALVALSCCSLHWWRAVAGSDVAGCCWCGNFVVKSEKSGTQTPRNGIRAALRNSEPGNPWALDDSSTEPTGPCAWDHGYRLRTGDWLGLSSSSVRRWAKNKEHPGEHLSPHSQAAGHGKIWNHRIRRDRDTIPRPSAHPHLLAAKKKIMRKVAKRGEIDSQMKQVPSQWGDAANESVSSNDW